MNNFEEITKNPETLGAFLRGLPVIEAPWDEEFQRKYCAGCGKVSCDDGSPCPYEEKRNNPLWWLSQESEGTFVEQNHRHHGPTVGHKFSIGLSDGEKIVGVAIVGRPVSRHLDDGWTLEVNRLCTDGTRNACSLLYAAAWRAARAMGYKRVVTYILDTENGASLRAAGWKCVGQAGGLRWTGTRRPEVDLCPAQMKIRFEREETT